MKIKLQFLIAGVLMSSLQAFAANIDRSFEARISAACVRSVEQEGRKIPNYRAVCQCIGVTHYNSAIRERIQAEALEQMQWTTEFYETNDMKKLQKMVDRNPKWSSFDDQVVDDCIMSANRGSKK